MSARAMRTMRRGRRARSGFSILEVVIATAILATVLALAGAATMQAGRLGAEMSARQGCAATLQSVMAVLLPELRQAVGADLAVAASPAAGAGPGTMISFKRVAGFDPDTGLRALAPAGAGDRIWYWYEPAAGGRPARLKRKEGAAPSAADLALDASAGPVLVLARDVAPTFAFTPTGTAAVTVTIQVTRPLTATFTRDPATGAPVADTVSVDGTTTVALWN